MFALIVAAAFQTSPPDLKLPLEKFTTFPDRPLAALGRSGHMQQRGFTLSDDGQYVVAGGGGDAALLLFSGMTEGLSLYEQPGDPKLPAISSSQKYVVALKAENKDKRFPRADIESVLAARGDRYTTALHSTSETGVAVRYGISTAHYANEDPAKNRSIAWFPAGREAMAYASDIASDSFLLGFWERPKDGGTKDLGAELVGEKKGGPYKFIPGITPFLLDTSRDLVICFLYTEQGIPFGYAYRTLESEKYERIQGPADAGLPQCGALLAGKRLVVYFAPRDEADAHHPGLYMTSGDFKSWEYLGPYALVGSSANGKALLISHLDLRRSYVVWPK